MQNAAVTACIREAHVPSSSNDASNGVKHVYGTYRELATSSASSGLPCPSAPNELDVVLHRCRTALAVRWTCLPVRCKREPSTTTDGGREGRRDGHACTPTQQRRDVSRACTSPSVDGTFRKLASAATSTRLDSCMARGLSSMSRRLPAIAVDGTRRGSALPMRMFSRCPNRKSPAAVFSSLWMHGAGGRDAFKLAFDDIVDGHVLRRSWLCFSQWLDARSWRKRSRRQRDRVTEEGGRTWLSNKNHTRRPARGRRDV